MKYTDGRYCCDADKATRQEMLTYVNNLLYAFFNNYGFSSSAHAMAASKFQKTLRELSYLLQYRAIFTQIPGLTDDLELPPDSEGNDLTLDEWVRHYKTQFPIPSNTLADAEVEMQIHNEIRRGKAEANERHREKN
jgi:hypothetical protein